MTYKLTFVHPDGSPLVVDANDGETVLDLAQKNGIDLEGACEGSMACSTCHIIVEDDWFAKLPDACEEEEDILDLAYGLSRTSRLGCQITMCADYDGLTVHVPSDGGTPLNS